MRMVLLVVDAEWSMPMVDAEWSMPMVDAEWSMPMDQCRRE
jgi:hypothetical protein